MYEKKANKDGVQSETTQKQRDSCPLISWTWKSPNTLNFFLICQSISGHLLQGVWFVLRQVLGTWVQNDSGLHAPNQSVSGLVTSHIGCT